MKVQVGNLAEEVLTMSHIENTCHYIRTKRYKRAAKRIASYMFEDEFLKLSDMKQNATVRYIAERLGAIHRDLRNERYPLQMTNGHRMELAWETYHELVASPVLASSMCL